MDAKQEAELNMQRGIEQHFDANTTITVAVPNFVAAANQSKTINAAIVSDIGGQEASRTGVAADNKQAAEDVLVERTLGIARVTRTFASDPGDNTLHNKLDLEQSDLKRLRDARLAPRCQLVHDRALEHKAALADYGITPAKLTALQDAINIYAALVPKPRAARAARSVKTTGLAERFRQGRKVLARTDDLIDLFKDDHPDFIAKYKDLRKIDKPPSRARVPKGEPKPE